MSIKLIHVSDIHFGSGESHGRLNPKTGLNVRFEDFAPRLEKVVDYTLATEPTFFFSPATPIKTAAPEPVYQRAFASQLKRLSDAKIPSVLLVGNHDQILKGGTSHAMSVFQSLEVPDLTVIETPRLLSLDTRHGKVQIIGIPHVTRHLLMTQAKYADYTSAEINRVLVRHLSEILKDFYECLEPGIPAILTAHMMLDNARAGAEQELMVGYSMTFPQEILLDERLDYVALGHVHGHQVLHEEKPLVAYAGSLERVDFGEEHEDKGFLEVEIERGSCSLRFHSISPRPFITVEADLTESEDPSEELFRIAKSKAVEGAVFRIKYRIQQSRLTEVDEDRLRASLPELFELEIQGAELSYSERPRRMPDVNEAAVLQPLDALERYLSELGLDNKEALLERARALIMQAAEQD